MAIWCFDLPGHALVQKGFRNPQITAIVILSFENAKFYPFLFLGFYHGAPNVLFCRNHLNGFSNCFLRLGST